MSKENLYESNVKEVLPASFDNFPENLKRVTLSLKERGEKISFKPLTFREASSLLPALKECAYVYKYNLEKFAPFVIPELKKKSSDDFFHREIRNFLTHKMGCLITDKQFINENQRAIINEGKDQIGNSCKNNGSDWNAIYSFFFNSLHEFCPQEEIFKIKPDPFVPLLNFAERGVLARTDHSEFWIDIPIISEKNGNKGYFYACWAPFREKTITHGHLADLQDCSSRKALEKKKLIVDNKSDVRSLIRPASWQ
jgi:hypothetical protein